jgi:hypothetical protein
MSLYRPKFIQNWLDLYREGGFPHLFRKKGWTIALAFFLFYLVRDSILYLFIPYFAYTQFSSCF